MRKRRSIKWQAAAAAATVASMLVTGCGGAGPGTSGTSQGTGAAQPGSAGAISFNYGVPTSAYPLLYVSEDLGLFAKAGLDPHFYSFQTGAPLLAGLKSGSLDVITTGLASIFAIGQGIPLTYIMWEDDPAGAEGLVAGPGTGIKTVQDLGRAKKVASPTGTCAQVSLYWAAKAAGIPYKNLNVVNIAPPLYANAFKSKSIDAGVAWAPYDLQLKQNGFTLVGFDPEWVPGGGACPDMVVARPAALKQQPQLAPRLVQVQAEAYAAVKKNPQVAVDALVKHLSITPAVAKETVDLFFKNFPTFSESLDPSSPYSMVGDKGLVSKLDLASRTFAELGVIPQPIPISKIQGSIDVQYIRAYVKEHPGS